MTQSFDEWFDKEYSNYGNSHKKTYDEKHDIYGSQFVDERYDAYKAGQQSCQAEVDEYKEVAESMEDAYLREKAKVDELQKRIEKTENWVESNKRNIPLSEWHGYTTEEYVDADDLLDILKGTTNEQ
ncbi:MAG: hypothetical protein RR623_00930 [Bacilli bacterium]